MISIDPELVRALVTEQFPQWKELPVEPVERQGWDNRTFRLGDELTVRLPSAEGYAAAVDKEHRCLSVLADQLPYPVPVSLAVGQPGVGYPFVWSVRRWLPGNTLGSTQLIDRDRLARDLGRFLTALRLAPTTGGLAAGRHSFYRGCHPSAYGDQVQSALDILRDEVDVAACQRVWREAMNSVWQDEPAWFHGDIAVGNLLIGDGELSAVIDFGTCGIGDPACDLVIAWNYLEGHDRQVFRRAVGLADDVWRRARGWALWKALVVMAGMSGPDPTQRRVLAEVLADPVVEAALTPRVARPSGRYRRRGRTDPCDGHNEGMYAIEISEPGEPDVLAWREAPDPVPGPDEVVIDVAAAGVNRADLMQRKGVYPPPAGASPYPGLECSGSVVAVGERVDPVEVGREVCVLLPGGGYATRVAVDSRLVLPIPAGISLIDAAALPEVAATVWSMLFQHSRLESGEMLLVHGGSGGIGTFAIQLATAKGVGVFATARAANHAALRDLGAELVIDYRDEDFVEVVREHTDGKGVDVIADNMGASYLEKNIQALRPNGRLAIIGLQGGRKGTIDLGLMLTKRVSVYAAGLRGRPLEERAEIIAQVKTYVWPLIADGSVRPIIAKRMPMPEAADAHRLLETGGHQGKVLLETP